MLPFINLTVWYWRLLSSSLTRLLAVILLITSVNRWRKYLHPHLLMWWKVSAQTQSTISPWQPSPTKALEPSPMKYPWRPSKPVCSHYYTSLCTLGNKKECTVEKLIPPSPFKANVAKMEDSLTPPSLHLNLDCLSPTQSAVKTDAEMISLNSYAVEFLFKRVIWLFFQLLCKNITVCVSVT